MLHQSTFPWASLVTGRQGCQETPRKTNVLMMKKMTLSISSLWKFPPVSCKLSLVLNSHCIQRHENYTRMEQKEINVFPCYHKTMWQMTRTGLPMEFPMWSLGPVQKNPKTWPLSFGPHHHFTHGNPQQGAMRIPKEATRRVDLVDTNVEALLPLPSYECCRWFGWSC